MSAHRARIALNGVISKFIETYILHILRPRLDCKQKTRRSRRTDRTICSSW